MVFQVFPCFPFVVLKLICLSWLVVWLVVCRCFIVVNCVSLQFQACSSYVFCPWLVGWMVGCLKFIGFQCVALCFPVFPCSPLYLIDMSLFALVGWLGPEPQLNLMLSLHPVSIHRGPKGPGALNPSFA